MTEISNIKKTDALDELKSNLETLKDSKLLNTDDQKEIIEIITTIDALDSENKTTYDAHYKESLLGILSKLKNVLTH